MPFKKNPPYYSVWASMLDRCRNPKNIQFADYGGRGIRVYERWKAYKNFAADMGPRPEGMTLDRIDNNGNYEPGNCRWATRKMQQRNQRRAVYVMIEGRRYRAIELADESGLTTNTIVNRAKRGLSYDEVMSPERRFDLSGFALGGKVSGAKQQAKTHCKAGHLMDEYNTRLTKEGWRRCRLCGADRTREYLRKKRGARS
jgi:hypothetical protein